MARRAAILALLCLAAAAAAMPGPARAVVKDEPAKAESGKDAPQGPQLVRLEPLFVAVVRQRQVERHVTVAVAIEPVDMAARKKIEAAMPRLRDAFLTDLYAYFGAVGYDGSSVAVQAMMARLVRAAERTLGKDVAKAVLLEGSSDRPLS